MQQEHQYQLQQSDLSPSTNKSQQAEPWLLLSPSLWGIQSNLEHEHPAVSLTEGEGLAMIFHNEPLQAPSFNAILEWDVELFCFPPTAHLQTRTTHELVMPPAIQGQQ
jgi:hypothetical protein